MQKELNNLSDTHVVLSTAYLAPVQYYSIFKNVVKVSLEQHEHYIKQTYRNRCRILSAGGAMDLSIPVEKISNAKQPIRDVCISYQTNWQQQHWRSIESAYNSTPFFEYYKDDFVPFYEKKWTFLWDFNMQLHEKVIELLDLDVIFHFTSEYQAALKKNTIDLRDEIHPKKETKSDNIQTYYQVFASKFGFTPNMSIVDLLFNMGNESILKL